MGDEVAIEANVIRIADFDADVIPWRNTNP